jgi:tetratricopeptide (TPR) repeat protein
MKNCLFLFLLFSTSFVFSQSNEEKYQKYIKSADSCYTLRNYEKAMVFYENALMFKPTEMYPKKKLMECDSYLQMIAEDNKVVIKFYYHQADSCFVEGNFIQAKQFYMRILNITPHEKDAQSKIAEIDKILYEKKE